MELKDFVGPHILTGVDRNTESISNYKEFEYSNVLNFELDGIVYVAVEDPDDDYRSLLKTIVKSNYKIQNQFPPCFVVGKVVGDEEEGENVLELTETKSGNVVLRIGTAYYDDYYPMWVAEFFPESMEINKGE